MEDLTAKAGKSDTRRRLRFRLATGVVVTAYLAFCYAILTGPFFPDDENILPLLGYVTLACLVVGLAISFVPPVGWIGRAMLMGLFCGVLLVGALIVLIGVTWSNDLSDTTPPPAHPSIAAPLWAQT